MREGFLVSGFWFLVPLAERHLSPRLLTPLCKVHPKSQNPRLPGNQRPEIRNQKPLRPGNQEPKTRNQRLVRAFTLVEVLAAMAFLGLVIPVSVRAILIANRAAEVSERSLTAVQLGENELSELMLANAWTSAESRGTFGDTQPGYRWELTKNDWQSGAMTELDLDVFFQVQGSERSVRLSTLVNEEIGEP